MARLLAANVFSVLVIAACLQTKTGLAFTPSSGRLIGPPSATCSRASAVQELFGRKRDGPPPGAANPFASTSTNGYTPSGMTPKEYTELKRREAQAEAKLDYGAWGPRFRRSEGAPDGDWMLQPRLWTIGLPSSFGSSNSGAPGGTETSGQRVRALIRRSIPPFVLAWILTDSILTGVWAYKVSKLTLRQAVVTLLHSLTLSRRVWAVTLWKIGTAKLAASAALTWPLSRYLEWASRRRLWTQRRTLLATAAGAVAALMLWSGLLVAVQ